MGFSLIYLGYRFIYRLGDFFRHWYVDGLRTVANIFISFLERADRLFAVAVTARFFFAPLYGDYSIVGRIVGVVFRSFRILFGSLFYLLLAGAFIVLAVTWIAIPVLIVAGALGHLPRVRFP